MLTSIHPLGERARGNRWWLTVTAFTVGSVSAAAGLGAILGFVGGFPLGDAPRVALAVTGVAVTVAAVLDAASVAPPGPKRQVNERWVGTYRGWVYGGAFGAQLGVGVATYVVTWLVPATLVAEFASGTWEHGALIGASFGLGRAVPLVAARWIDRPSRLVSTSRAMAGIARPAFVSFAVIAGSIGIVGLLAARM